MACVLGRKAFSFKNMAQVPAALRTDNFSAPAIGVGHMLHSARDFVVKAGPAAARLELVFAAVELRIALPAHIDAGRFVVLILAGARVLRALVDNNTRLFDG